MAQSTFGKANRFYKNPMLRDEEWSRATSAPVLLVVLVIAIIAVALFAGFYGDRPYNILGWILAVVTLLIYGLLARVRRNRARRQLREAHGQT